MKELSSDYFGVMNRKIHRYREKHGGNYRIAAFKLALLNLFYSIKPGLTGLGDKNYAIQRGNEILSIALMVGGSIDDYIVFANYLYCFSNKYSKESNPIAFDIYVMGDIDEIKHVLKKDGLYEFCKPVNTIDKLGIEYGMVIRFNKIPVVTVAEKKKLLRYNPELVEYVKRNREYINKYPEAHGGDDLEIIKACLAEGKEMFQKADLCGALGIDNQYSYTLPMMINEEGYLEDLGIDADQYIVIDTDKDKNNQTLDINDFRKIAEFIGKKYPTVAVIQMGYNGKPIFGGNTIFKDLVNQCDLEQTKVLIKNAKLYIGKEGTLLLLREALHGGSSIMVMEEGNSKSVEVITSQIEGILSDMGR